MPSKLAVKYLLTSAVFALILASLPSISLAQTPQIAVTHTQSLVGDQNNNNEANEGDTIGYTVTVKNPAGGQAHNVHVDLALDPNTTLVPGSINVQPFAVNDGNFVTENAVPNTTTGNFLLNDAGQDTGQTLAVVSVGGSTSPGTVTGDFGSLAWASNGTYTYSLNNANGGVQALDSGQTLFENFGYTINDGIGPPSGATVRIAVIGVNDAPVSTADVYSSFTNRSVTVDVAHGLLANDTDPESQTLHVSAFDSVTARGGAAAVNTDGSFTYTPNMATGQVDTFNYTVQDSAGATSTNTASVTATGRIIFVNNTNSPPGTGTFANPYHDLDDALTGSLNNDIVYIYHGSGTASGMDLSYTIGADNMQIVGEGAPLILNGTVQIASGSPPLIQPVTASGPVFTVTNKSFSIEGVTIDGINNTGSPANLLVTQSAAATTNIRVFRSTFSNTSKSVAMSVTGTGIRNLLVDELTTNGNSSAGIAVDYNGNTSGTVNVSNSTFNTSIQGVNLISKGGANVTGNVKTSTFNGAGGALGVVAFTNTGGTLNLNLTQGNQITGLVGGLAIEQQAGSTLNVSITPSPSPDNNISGNTSGVCNENDAALISINPASQVNGNTTNFTNTGCGAG